MSLSFSGQFSQQSLYLHMQEPCMQTHQGAVMVTDITGFTALTEDLGRRGAAGVELLTRCMNNFFTLVIELVRCLSQTCSEQPELKQ